MSVKFCERIIEACWLAALAAIPVFFNPYTSRVFESDKTYLLRSIVIIMIAAWFIRKSLAGSVQKTDRREKITGAVMLLTLALGLIYLISSALSIAPYFSFKGYFLREEGFQTMACYLFFFFIMADRLREPGQIKRIFHTMLISATMVSAYGILQYYKIDTVAWAGGERTRVTTTLGGPIFAGAYLIMVIPLILSRLTRCLNDGFGKNPGLTLIYGLILSINVFCMFLTKSRGPFVGFIISLFIFFILFVRLKQMKSLFISAVTAGALIITFLIILNIPQGPLSGLQKYFGRFAQLYETEGGGGKVRLLIWEGAVEIIKSAPQRLAFGHGLESMFPLYHKHIPSSFNRYEGSSIPDHSHNDTFDIIITSGILGLLAYLSIIALLIYHALNRLGFFNSGYSVKLFIRALAGGLFLGLIIPLIMGKSIYLGLTIPFGFIAGLFSYLLITWKTRPIQGDFNPLLIIGLISALIGHLAELQFGMGVTATRLYFWTYAALILFVPKTPILSVPNQKSATTQTERRNDTESKNRLSHSVIYGLIGGLLMAGFSFALLKRKFLMEGIPQNFYTIVLSLGALSALYLIFAAVRTTRVVETIAFLLSMAASAVGFHLVLLARLESLSVTAPAVINSFYIFTLLIIIGIAITLKNNSSGPAPKGIFTGILAAIMLIPLSITAIYYTNLRDAYADAWCREAENHEKGRRWPVAIDAFGKAISLAPRADYYYAGLARVYKQSDDYRQAIDTLQNALKSNPLNRFHNLEIARAWRDWAGQLKDNPEDQKLKLDQALAEYENIFALTPKNPIPLKEAGQIHFSQSDYQLAIEYCARATALDDRFPDAYLVMGKSYLKLNQPDKAIEYHEKAYRASQGQPLIRSEFIRLGEDYFNQERFEESLRVNLALIALEPDDFQHYHNTSVVLDKLDRLDDAIEYSLKAMEKSMPHRREGVNRFRQRLQQKKEKP